MHAQQKAMAMSSAKVVPFGLLVLIFVTVVIVLTRRIDWPVSWTGYAKQFWTLEGIATRIALLLFVVFNWKSIPLVWTFRIVSTILYHTTIRKSPQLGPKALFKPIISSTHTPLLETDYYVHKSNSTYFADLDIARAHLITYLFRNAFHRLSKNAEFRIILNPKTGIPLTGRLGINLGAVVCNFKREIPAYKPFEMWSRVLAWDRKWLYIVTHFLPKGAVLPKEWLDPRFGKTRKRGQADASDSRDKKMYAMALSKYVFKLGRLTVHPAVVLEQAGLLPDRPGGWANGEQQLGNLAEDVSDVDMTLDGAWDWRRVEAERRKGMELASKLHSLDQLDNAFDGGDYGAIGKFVP